ncbi:MAG: SH3 domain-containing protein [Candidatus Aminicenantes bacterium]|nr:SH3 domain-containing protein [Candidatus Aminicenantes bacterium]
MKRKIFIFALWLALSSSLLLPLDAPKFPFRLEVATEQANIREKPDIGSVIIRQVPRGTILESTKKIGEWYLVRLKAEEDQLLLGYVHESLVLRIESEAEEPELIEEEKIVAEEKLEEEEKPEAEKKIPEEKGEEPKKEKIQIAPPPTVTPMVLEPSEKRFMLSILGGGNYISGGDLNEGAEGFGEFYQDELQIEGGESKPLHLAYIFGAELSFPLTSRIFLGIGADYFRGRKESSVEQSEITPGNSFTTRPEIQALPLRAFFSYYPVSFLFLKGGVEYYFAKISYYYRFQEGEYWKEWEGNADSRGIGIMGALGMEWNLASRISFFAEATGRYAKINGFEGDDTSRDTEGLIYTEAGTLYSFQVTGTSQKVYPQLFIRDRKPAEARVSDAREAEVDFSGIALRLGFRIKF